MTSAIFVIYIICLHATDGLFDAITWSVRPKQTVSFAQTSNLPFAKATPFAP